MSKVHHCHLHTAAVFALKCEGIRLPVKTFKRPEWLGRVIVESMLKLKYTSQILTDVEVTKLIRFIRRHQELKKEMLL